MKNEVELELKTIVSQEQFYKLLEHYLPLKFVTQHNYYYVTNDISHYGFRVRVIDGKKLFTLKRYDNGTTYEYEKTFEGKMEDDKEIISILKQFNIEKPYTLFGELITERAIYFNGFGELCFDINHYNGLTDYELEYEVKKEHDYKQAFNEILAKADIEFIPSWGSKYKRCLKTKGNLD